MNNRNKGAKVKKQYIGYFIICSCLMGQVAWAKFELNENGMVKPFSMKERSLQEFVDDYAAISQERISYSNRLFGKKMKLSLQNIKPVSLGNLRESLIHALSNENISLVEDEGGITLVKERDIRNMAGEVYSSQSYPHKTYQYITVVHKLSYPLGKEVVRNGRHMLSRYGRIIALDDGKTILINEKGNNIERLILTAQAHDTSANYENERKKKIRKAKEAEPISELNKKLEEENEELKKKLEKLESNSKKDQERKG